LAGNVEKIIDFRDSLSSISLLKVTQVFSSMDFSEILEIRGIDGDLRQDLFKVLPQQAYEIIEIEDAAETNDLNRVRIRKCG